MTHQERYEEYCQAKRELEEIPFTFEDWLWVEEHPELARLSELGETKP